MSPLERFKRYVWCRFLCNECGKRCQLTQEPVMINKFKAALLTAGRSKYTTTAGLAILGVYAAYRLGYIPQDLATELAMLGTVLLGLLVKDAGAKDS